MEPAEMPVGRVRGTFMSFGNILGELLQQGMPGQHSTRNRVGTSAQHLSKGGTGLEQIMGQLQSALRGSSATPGATSAQANPMAGFAEAAKAFLGDKQSGGMTGAQLGGLGALAGAVLGGGSVKGAARGGALAILGSLALNALQKSRAAQAGTPSEPAQITASEVEAVASPASERLALRAMIAAAKSDGQIDQAEMDAILGRIASDDVTAEERAFVLEEIRKPVDPGDIAREVTSPAQAAEVYAASLLAIDVDSDAERDYLRRLAAALDLDAAAVAYLHETTGAPRP
jgi:uncharacterized membrane protein YebE (DUF533 family)